MRRPPVRRLALAAREAELVPVSHFHVVFTLPAALRGLVRAHQRVLFPLLMCTAAESLQALAADPRYVGGTLGILALIHTWRTMTSPGEEFLRRFLPLVLPRGMHKVRYYGLWHPTDHRPGAISIDSRASAVSVNRDFASGFAPQDR